MTREFKYMIYLFSCGARGIKTEIDPEIDLEAVKEYARIQNCLHTVLYAIKISGTPWLPYEKQDEMNRELQRAVLTNYARYIYLLNLLKNFDDAKIRYAVLKGYSAAALYASPFCRLSGDVDLFVNNLKEEKAVRILTENGCCLKRKRSEGHHHSLFEHPNIGKIELHISFNPETAEEIWLNCGRHGRNAKNIGSEKHEQIILDGKSFYALGANDRLLQLFFHITRHFIEGGLGIRSIMDFILTYIKNSNIDYKEFWNRISGLRFDRFCRGLFGLAVKYCGFSKKEIPYFNYDSTDEADIETLLYDMEKGGWLGYLKSDSDSSDAEYTKHKEAELGILFRIKVHLKKTFLSYSAMARRYSYLENYPFLLPFAWLVRIITNMSNNKNILSENRAVTNNTGNTREAIFKQFGMIN